jgi:hypothetical protein
LSARIASASVSVEPAVASAEADVAAAALRAWRGMKEPAGALVLRDWSARPPGSGRNE